jgi:hypothetical protein
MKITPIHKSKDVTLLPQTIVFFPERNDTMIARCAFCPHEHQTPSTKRHGSGTQGGS